MSKAKVSRIKSDSVQAPQTQAEAEQMIADIGHLQREVTVIEAAMNEKLAGIKAHFEQRAQPLNEQIERLFQAVFVWAEANRHDLVNGRSKTANLATGTIKWRLTPPKVSVSGSDAVIGFLKELGLTQFIRVKEEIDKEAILADQDSVKAVKGIGISQKEEFSLIPFESQIERVKASKLKEAA